MSDLLDRISTLLVEPLGWTLVHSLWQLATLGALFAIAMNVMRRRSASARYAVCGLTLCLTVLMPMVSFWWLLPRTETPVDMTIDVDDRVHLVAEPTAILKNRGANDGVGSDSSPGVTSPPFAEPFGLNTNLPFKSVIERCLPFLVVSWMAGVFLISLWNFCGWVTVQRMARFGTRRVPQAVHQKLTELATRMGIQRYVHVAESVMVRTPSVIGFLRPIVLLPLGVLSGLTPAELEAVLAHELAHIRRHDFLANLLQTFVETLLFYHPAVWYVSRRMRVEREYCADQMAAELLGDPIEYARSLTFSVEHLQATTQFALQASGGELLDRIRRLFGLDTRDNGRTGSWLLGALSSLIVLFSLAAVPPIHSAVSQGNAPQVKIYRVWADDGEHNDYRVSPDGRFIAYVDWEKANLGVHDRETGMSRLLTTEGTWKSPNRWPQAPVWSPDSTRLAYVWMFDEQPPQLRILSIADARPRTLYAAEERGFAYTADWLPDGSHLLTTMRDSEQRPSTSVINVTDGSVVHLQGVPAGSDPGDVSPDGRFVTLVQRSADGNRRDIYLYDLSTGRSKPLIEHPADDFSPLWSPNGRWLTFLSTRTGDSATWMVRMANGRSRGSPRQMCPDLRSGAALGFSQRGVYYFSRRAPREIFSVAYDAQRGVTERSPQLLVRHFEGHNHGAAWSFDGTKLAYFSVRPTSHGSMRPMPVVRDEVARRESINEADFKRYFQLAWLPDGKSVLLRATTHSGTPGIFRWDIEQRSTTPVVTWKRTAYEYISPAFCVSPNGEAIFYSLVRKDTSHVIRRQLADGEETEVAELPATGTLRPLISPNGKLLALKSQSSIGVVQLDSGKFRILHEAKDSRSDWTRGIAWERDSQRLLFWASINDSPSSLWRVAVGGGEPQRVGLSRWGERTMDLHDLHMHPNGEQISFTAGRHPYNSEVWAIENSLVMQSE